MSNNLPDKYDNMVMSFVKESIPKWEVRSYCEEWCGNFAYILEPRCLKVQR